MSFNKNTLKNTQGGQVMMILVLLVLSASLTIVLGIAAPILKEVKISQDMVHSKESYYVAEGVLEDAVIRAEAGKTVATGDTLTINGYTATLSVTTSGSGKTLDVSADRGGLIRKMEAKLTTGVGASFNYGIQSGNGGFVLSGGSSINGNVYSNGDIIATNGVTITGSAVAANSSALASDQSNSGATPISSCTTSTCITFRNVAASQDVAQSFQVSTSSPVNKVQLYVKKTGAPADATVRIVTDSSGSPGTSNMLATNGTLSASLVSTSAFGWIDVVFPDNPVLSPGQTYWLVVDNSTQNSSNYYQIGATSGGYANGTAKIGSYSGTWTATSPSGLDTYFNLYLGGINATIGSGTYAGSVNIGSAGVGDAWAHTVSGASVAGSLYCQAGSNNNKACNTSRTDPSSIGLPLSDANIQEFKDEATTTGGWTYVGNLSIGSAGTTTTTLQHVTGNLTVSGGGTADISALQVDGNVSVSGGGTLKVGPMKVNGTLTVGSNMTMKGTVWVAGNITVSGGASVKLDTSYGTNSGVMVSDGNVSITGGGSFAGSGQTGSYPLVVTTSNCPTGSSCGGTNAVEFSGGAGAVIINAQSGTIHMSGGTSAKSLTGNEIDIDGGGSVTYDSGLANLNFSSGPSGGWNITTWKEVQ